MFWTFNLCLDILATVWATFPNIGQIFVQLSGHLQLVTNAVVYLSVAKKCSYHQCLIYFSNFFYF
jgi:hypothetical protein